MIFVVSTLLVSRKAKQDSYVRPFCLLFIIIFINLVHLATQVPLLVIVRSYQYYVANFGPVAVGGQRIVLRVLSWAGCGTTARGQQQHNYGGGRLISRRVWIRSQ